MSNGKYVEYTVQMTTYQISIFANFYNYIITLILCVYIHVHVHVHV